MRAAVIGGGLQGCGVALELADRGVRVDLFERSSRLLQGASRHSEGKIHLGYVYTADESLRTARLMATGAASFLPAMRRWLGPSADHLVMSTPFRYAVHRETSRSPDRLDASYRVISDLIRTAFDGDEMSPLLEIDHLRRLEPGDDWPYGADIVRAYETGEVAIETTGLADAVERAVVAHPQIEAVCDATVTSVEARDQTVAWDRQGENQASAARYDHVVNCSWDGLPKLDATAGLPPARPWSFRMKYFVRLAARDASVDTPSTTFVLGQFGDVVDFGDGGRYFSWYPAARLGFSTELEPPAWKAELPPTESGELAGQIVDGLGAVMPAVADLREVVSERGVVRGGVIYAHGDTDLADNNTELHQRHSIGLTSVGQYHSVNTGKMTMAPHFARAVAEHLCGSR